MHPHPAKHDFTVAINALWCLLIALVLLALPLIARQARIQNRIAPQRASAAPSPEASTQPDSSAMLVTLSEVPASSN